MIVKCIVQQVTKSGPPQKDKEKEKEKQCPECQGPVSQDDINKLITLLAIISQDDKVNYYYYYYFFLSFSSFVLWTYFSRIPFVVLATCYFFYFVLYYTYCHYGL